MKHLTYRQTEIFTDKLIISQKVCFKYLEAIIKNDGDGSFANINAIAKVYYSLLIYMPFVNSITVNNIIIMPIIFLLDRLYIYYIHIA